ncbi:MAG: O-antigen ligase family protein [Armatimonadetes bacterium]|nr:O-antigen ligase family protein [Armatimonadota bacterium]
MKRLQPELVPLLLAAFLAPIIGGNVTLDAQPLTEGFLSGMLGGSELPQCARALLGILVALSITVALYRRPIVQIPSLPLAGGVLSLVTLLGLTIFESRFPYVSYASWLTWVVYGLCFFGAVAVVGRKTGVRALCWALAAGGGVTACKAILEYAAFKSKDPSHRVFGDWNNPNALAGVLAVIAPVAFGLVVSSERAESLAAGFLSTLMLIGLVLTQSKGGLLTVGVALVVFAAVATAWRCKGAALKSGLVVAATAALVFATFASTRAQSGALGRITNAGSTSEQSAGFRQLLWKGALQMVKARPGGFGVGTYRFESGRPGLTEQTFHAHQTWLQLAVEGSPLATLILVFVSLLWLKTFLSHPRHWPPDEAAVRAGILGAIVAAAIGGLFETNLTYFGTGIVVFLLLGAGLQASSDGSMPEFTPAGIRRVLVLLACVVPVVMLVHTASEELLKSQAKTAMLAADRLGAQSAIESAQGLAPFDGETYYLSTAVTEPSKQAAVLALAAKYQPSTKYLRAAAKKAQEAGDVSRALGFIDMALETDPNNLATLEYKYKFLAQNNNLSTAVEIAKRLVKVEDGPYFTVRAIPDLVPLETYDARIFLASQESDPLSKAALLEQAVKGFAEYYRRTVPMVRDLTGNQPGANFLGHDADEAKQVATTALKAIEDLRSIYRSTRDSSKGAELDSLEALFRED